jgi:hypothetical protein
MTTSVKELAFTVDKDLKLPNVSQGKLTRGSSVISRALTTSGTWESNKFKHLVWIPESVEPNAGDKIVFFDSSKKALSYTLKDGFSAVEKSVDLNESDEKYLEESDEPSAPAEATPVLPPPATSGAARAAGVESAPISESGPEEDLQRFLAQHVDLYFNSIPDDMKTRYASSSALGPKIAPGKWGPASRAALAGFAAFVGSGPGDFFRGSNIDKALEPLSDFSFDGRLEGWKGATVSGVAFDTGLRGLLDYLKFAYVATRPAGESGYGAAKKMDITTTYRGPGGYFPDDPTWQALCKLGAISPFFYFVIAPPSGMAISADAKIEVGGANLTHKGAPAGSQVALALGLNPSDKIPDGVPGAGAGVNASGGDAAKILSAGPKEIKLTIGDRTWIKSVTLEFGTVVQMGEAGAAAASAPSAAGPRGGYSLLPVGVTVPGRTMRQPPKALQLQNIYVDASGGPATRNVTAVLEKEPKARGDLFRVAAENDYILVPVQLPAPLREARHWVETLLAAPPSTGKQQGLVYFPVKSFTILNNYNRKEYGPEGAGEALRVVYEPVDPTNLAPDAPAGLTIVSAEEIDARGRGTGDFTPAQAAIANYFLTANNPTRTPLYRTSELNRKINSYPVPPPARVG